MTVQDYQRIGELWGLIGFPFDPSFSEDMTDMQTYIYISKLEAVVRPFWTWPAADRERFFERYPHLRSKRLSGIKKSAPAR